MKRKTISLLLSVLMLGGCGKTKEPAASPTPAAGGASPSAVPADPQGNDAAAALTYSTETVGEVSFDISSQWTKEVSGNANIYYRLIDAEGNYDAYILADASSADYGSYGSKEEALEKISNESLPNGAKTVFANPITVGGADGYQIEFESASDAGDRICDMMIIGGPTLVTRIMFSQFKEGEVDYGTEFEEIWKTVTVEGSAGSPFSSRSEEEKVGEAIYQQSDYILNCYEKDDGVTACDAMLEITNAGDVPIWLSDGAYFDIFNESGEVIASCTQENIDLIPEVIEPGERGYYVTRKGIELPGGYFAGHAYELGGKVFPAKAERDVHGYPLEIVTVTNDNGKPAILGYVTNNTDHDYPNIQLYVVYYSNDDRPVAAAHDYIGKLEPGTRQPFTLGGDLTFESASIAEVSNYIAYAREAYNPE